MPIQQSQVDRKSIVLECLKATCDRWVPVSVVALRTGVDEAEVSDLLAVLDVDGEIDVEMISDEPRVRVRCQSPLTNDQVRILNILRQMVPDWYSPAVIVDFARWTVDRTLDTLSDLGVRGDILITEFDSGPMVRIAEEKVQPLSETERTLVEDNLDLVELQVRLSCRRPDLKEDLTSFLNLELVELVRRYTSGDFRIYARHTLNRAVKQYWRSVFHLRGLSRSEGIEVEPIELNEPYAPDELGRIDDAEELEKMLACLPPDEKEAVVLTEMFELTANEVGDVTGRSSSEVWRSRKKGLKSLQGNAQGITGERDAINDTNNPFMNLPRFLLGVCRPWQTPFKQVAGKRKKRNGPCPICANRDLGRYEYCLFCDRWGFEVMNRVVANKKPQAAVMKMVTSGDYRSKIA